MRRVLGSIPYWKGALIISTFFLCFQAFSYAADVTLQWDANTEPDLAGYRLYYKTGSSGAPYDGTGATEGASPIDAENVTEFTLHSLSDTEVYFFVVTAHDTEDLESEYSNEVTASTEPTPTPTPTAAESDGGGCFIATAAFGSR